LINYPDSLPASESSSRAQLIVLGLTAIGLITVVGAIFFTRNECAQPADRPGGMVARITSSLD
jgi:hypothetical protein